MDLNTKEEEKMINLLISGDSEQWKTNTALLNPKRCLTEYITDDIRTRFAAFGADEIAEIKKFPSIFAYEKYLEKDARVGYITEILMRQNNVKIDYKFSGETIHFKDLIKLQDQLDLDILELNRTHWTIKNVDIKEIISDFSHKNTVFISYSYDDIEHENWVVNLATQLKSNQVDVILDKWDLKLGNLLPNFMEKSIENSQRVICIMTPNYKKKTDKLNGGVGYEYSIISAKIFQDVNTSKFIPLIKNGKNTDAIPIALQGRKYLDMRDKDKFDEKFKELLDDLLQ